MYPGTRPVDTFDSSFLLPWQTPLPLFEDRVTRETREMRPYFMISGNEEQLLLQLPTCCLHPCDVDGIRSRINVANDARFVDDKGGPASHPSLFVQYSVQPAQRFRKIAQHGEFNSHFFCKFLLGGPSIHTYRQNFRIFCFKVVDIRLISLQLGRSATGKGKNVEGKRHVLLTGEIGKTHGIPVLILQFEVGGLVAHLQESGLGPSQRGKQNN